MEVGFEVCFQVIHFIVAMIDEDLEGCVHLFQSSGMILQFIFLFGELLLLGLFFRDIHLYGYRMGNITGVVPN